MVKLRQTVEELTEKVRSLNTAIKLYSFAAAPGYQLYDQLVAEQLKEIFNFRPPGPVGPPGPAGPRGIFLVTNNIGTGSDNFHSIQDFPDQTPCQLPSDRPTMVNNIDTLRPRPTKRTRPSSLKTTC